jgi:hypothetical protein
LRSVALDLFHQSGSNALDQPDAIRAHGQELLGRINPGFDKYAYYPLTEPTLYKPLIPIKFVCSDIHVSFSPPMAKIIKKVFWGQQFFRGVVRDNVSPMSFDTAEP